MSKSSWWPRGIIAFFVALAAFESWFVYVAMTEHRSTVIEDRPYEAGLKFGEVIEGTRAAKAAGLSLDLTVLSEGLQGTVRGLDLSQGWNIKLSALRLNDPTADQHRNITVTGSPFSVGLTAMKPGLYLVRTWLERGDTRYFFESYVQR